MAWIFGNLKAHTQWHTSCNKATPPNPPKQFHQWWIMYSNIWAYSVIIIQTTTSKIFCNARRDWWVHFRFNENETTMCKNHWKRDRHAYVSYVNTWKHYVHVSIFLEGLMESLTQLPSLTHSCLLNPSVHTHKPLFQTVLWEKLKMSCVLRLVALFVAVISQHLLFSFGLLSVPGLFLKASLNPYAHFCILWHLQRERERNITVFICVPRFQYCPGRSYVLS